MKVQYSVAFERMAERKVIAINQSESDPDLKGMIAALQKAKGAANPYWKRSESEVAKILLQRSLTKEYKRICGKGRKR